MNDNCACGISTVYLKIYITPENKNFERKQLWKWVKKVEVSGWKWKTFKQNTTTTITCPEEQNFCGYIGFRVSHSCSLANLAVSVQQY